MHLHLHTCGSQEAVGESTESTEPVSTKRAKRAAKVYRPTAMQVIQLTGPLENSMCNNIKHTSYLSTDGWEMTWLRLHMDFSEFHRNHFMETLEVDVLED